MGDFRCQAPLAFLARHPERSEGSVVNGQILRRLPLADSSE
jgi:hypothetical protein